MQPFQYSLVADSVFEKGSEMHFIIRFMNTYLKLIFICMYVYISMYVRMYACVYLAYICSMYMCNSVCILYYLY